MTLQFINYAIQISILTSIFYVAYRLIFRHQKHFILNRIYLISALFLSWIIPLINVPIDFLSVINLPAALPVSLQELTVSGSSVSLTESLIKPDANSSLFSWWTLYWIGTFVIVFNTTRVISKICVLRFKNKCTRHQGFHIIEAQNIPSFSLFNWIFIDKNRIQGEGREIVLSHEFTHAKQLHSLDLIFVELITALLWFNPIIWYYKRSLKECHEFLADEAVLNQGYDLKSYVESLQIDYFTTRDFKLASYFKGSTLKRRIEMATKKKQKYAGLKHLYNLPIIAISLMLFSCVSNPFQVVDAKVQSAYDKSSETFDSDSVELNEFEQINLKIEPQPSPLVSPKIISYSLDKNASIEINIYDSKGRQVASLLKGYQEKGKHKIKWNVPDYSTNDIGLYICRFTINDVVIKSIIL